VLQKTALQEVGKLLLNMIGQEFTFSGQLCQKVRVMFIDNLVKLVTQMS